MPDDIKPVVLVVEDDVVTRLLFTRVLEGSGFSVREAEDGKAAEKMIHERIPSVVVCDMAMPGASGLHVIDVLRARAKDVPVIAVTSYAEDDDVWRGVGRPWDRYMRKPVDPLALVDAIRELLAKSKRARKR